MTVNAIPRGLDDDFVALVASVENGGGTRRFRGSPEAARAGSASLSRMFGKGADVASVETVVVEATDRSIKTRVFHPVVQHSSLPIVYLHGGGWVTGSVEQYEAWLRVLCAVMGQPVVAVEYRLAPEHPFPAALDDVWAVCESVSAGLLGEPGPLVLAGDSAGGAIAALTAAASRDSTVEIAFQILICPATDHLCEQPSQFDEANQLLVDRPMMQWYWAQFVPDPDQRHLGSPLSLERLDGMPPTVIVTAEFDVLRDEGELFGKRLAEAGVPVRRRRFAGQLHDFVLFADRPSSELCAQFIASETRQLLGG